MPDTIIEHIATITQPVEVSVKVGMEIDSKGQRKPSVEIKTTQHLTHEQAVSGLGLDMIIENMLAFSLTKCINTIKKAMEEK